jgi:hypothetical protein
MKHLSSNIFSKSLDQMNCCPSADFTFLTNGIETREKNIQADENTHVFIAFKAIDTINYTYSKEEGGLITIWVKKICYRYTFPCSSGKDIYDAIIRLL